MVSCLLGGVLFGRSMGVHRFIWGMIVGLLYFTVLFVLGKLILQTDQTPVIHCVSCFMICGVAGMLGGMLAPESKHI